MKEAFDDLGAVGAAVSSCYGTGSDASTEFYQIRDMAASRTKIESIADDRFDRVWEELDRRNAIVFLHGAQVPASSPIPHPALGIPITEVNYGSHLLRIAVPI